MSAPIIRLLLISTSLALSISSYAYQETTATEAPLDLIRIPIDATFDVTSNYLSQGISNTNNSPGIQGGLTYTFKSTGIYVKAWGSNTDFLSLDLNHATVEFDAITGIEHSICPDISYNLFLDRYIYPGASDGNYTDLIGSVSYKIFTATLYYSFNVFGAESNGMYLNGAINYDIPEKYIHIQGVSALASIGHYQLPIETGIHSYYDFMVGIQEQIKQFTFTLQWTDTANANFPPYDGYHIVGTMLINW